jgi:hypothetical protein
LDSLDCWFGSSLKEVISGAVAVSGRPERTMRKPESLTNLEGFLSNAG